MGNKVKYNLKNVHAAKLTRSEDGSFTYAKPKAIPGAVSISLDAEGDSSPFYADGIVYFRSTANNGYSGDLEIALIPEWFRTEILKEELDNNGVLIENATITELEKFRHCSLSLTVMSEAFAMCFTTALPLVLPLNLRLKRIPSSRVKKSSRLPLILERMVSSRAAPVMRQMQKFIRTGTSRFMCRYLRQKDKEDVRHVRKNNYNR